MKIDARVLWGLLGVVLLLLGGTLRYIWVEHSANDMRDRALIEVLTVEAAVTDRVIDDLAGNLHECLEVCR